MKRQFKEGKTELISINDTILNDSAMIFGFARWIDVPISYMFQGPFEIWIDNNTRKVTSDSTGYYLLKTLPGTYTINCQSIGNNRTQLIEKLENIKIEKNRKIHIDFSIGTTIE